MEEVIKNNESLDVDTSSTTQVDNNEASKINTPRKSGIELLKIIAIFLIVLSHVLRTLSGSGSESLLGDWVINFTSQGSGFRNLVLCILQYSGQLGNIIFVVCSSWFLLDKETSNKKKLLRIFIDVFVISIIYLICLGAYMGFKTLTIEEIIKSIFPNYFAANWFITCYFVFALISPILNKVIKSFSKNTHFVVSLVFFFLFFIAGFIYGPDSNINCALIVWITIYFIVAYFKLYGQKFCASKKINIILLLIGILGIITITAITYYLGTKISLLQNATSWSKANSPFFLCIAFGSLNLFNKTKFTNKFINYISSLSFLIYIIHDNILFRTYIRPQIWNYIYTNLGYNLLFVWLLVYTIVLFVVAMLISVLYNVSLRKSIHKLSDKIYQLLVKIINWCQTKLINIIK